MTEIKIFKVVFNEPPMECCDRKEFFFSSLSAIYETFTPEQIGCKVTRLWSLGVSKGASYSNDRCTITRTTLRTKAQKNRAAGRKEVEP